MALLFGSSSGLTIVSAMVTPAILILSAGNLVASTLTRIARVVDRARDLMESLRQAGQSGDHSAVKTHRQMLHTYARRSLLLERALSGFYFAIALFVLASLSVVLELIRPNLSHFVTTSLVVIGALVLLYGAANVFLETRLATGGLRQEIMLAEAEVENSSPKIG